MNEGTIITLSNPVRDLNSVNKELQQVAKQKRDCYDCCKALEDKETRLISEKIDVIMGRTLLTVALVFMTACGGGGGSSTDSPECKTYCAAFCNKVTACGYLDRDNIKSCSSECHKITQDIGRTELNCSQTREWLLSASCRQVEINYELRTKQENNSIDDYAAFAAQLGW